MRKTRITVLILGLLAVTAAIAFLRTRDGSACEVTNEVKDAPGGRYRAQKTEKACGWGFGLASDLVEVRIDKLVEQRWFTVMPLEYDGFANPDVARVSPTIEWTSPNSLKITVYSREVAGSLVRRIDDLTITRHYVEPPK